MQSAAIERTEFPPGSDPHINVSRLPPVERSGFIEAMSHAVKGVSILSTDGTAGRFGITVSSVTSLSADPPMVLACINRRSPVCAAVRENGVFNINLLSAGQRQLADVFAGRPEQGRPYDFGRAHWADGCAGAPRLEGAVSVFECRLAEAIDAASHTILIGLVVAAIGNGGTPLLYTGRDYGFPSRFADVDAGPVQILYLSENGPGTKMNA